MVKILTGIFLILHGLVHLLYYGQSARKFELQKGLTWPDGSWAFDGLLGASGTRMLAGILCILAAAGFVLGAAGVFLEQAWWRAAVVAAAGVSATLYILFWNGSLKKLDDQGGIGLLMDLAILALILVFRWPEFDF
jgi:hypothetical protein